MVDLDRLFRPTFEERKDGSERTADERDHASAITTYRYLRLGMVVIVVALIAALILRRSEVGCWQGSISAYYYDPPGPIFVSGMLAIGLALIVIKGSTVVEDFLLNAAGMLAPIVAFVPTTEGPKCVPGKLLEDGKGGPLADDIISEVRNNIHALLIAGSVAVAVAFVVFVIDQIRGNRDVETAKVKSRVFLLVVSAAAVGLGWRLLDTEKILDLHGWSAVVMFGFLGVASVWNGAWLIYCNRKGRPRTSEHWWLLAGSYLLVGITMGVGGALIRYGVDDPWPHRILVLELMEIGLFAAMWLVQSVERWGKITATAPARASGPGGA